MQIVILAGGRGERLKPMTEKIPKPMVKIHNKPFLLYQLEMLRFFGLKDILLLVSYLGNYVEEYFGSGLKFGLEIKYSYERTPMGTAGALKNAKNKLDNEFLLLNGDTYLPVDYAKFIDYFPSRHLLGLITVYTSRNKIITNNTAIDNHGFVLGYNKRASAGMNCTDAGVMAFKKGILDIIPETQVYQMEELFLELIKIKQLGYFSTNKMFYDMGDPRGLIRIKRILH